LEKVSLGLRSGFEMALGTRGRRTAVLLRSFPLVPLGVPFPSAASTASSSPTTFTAAHARSEQGMRGMWGVGCAGVPVGMESLLKVFLRGGAAKAVTDRQPHSRSVTSDCSGANTIALIGPGRTRSLSHVRPVPHTPHTPHTPHV